MLPEEISRAREVARRKQLCELIEKLKGEARNNGATGSYMKLDDGTIEVTLFDEEA